MQMKQTIFKPKLVAYLGIAVVIIFALTTLIVGLVTPGYNHLENTVSYLIINQYGFIINGLLAAMAVITALMGLALAQVFQNLIMFRIFGIYSLAMLLLVFFPTDPCLNKQILGFSQASFSGKAHFTIVLTTVIISPWLVKAMIKHFMKKPGWQKFKNYTLAFFISSGILGIGWFVCFFLGINSSYKGLIQKIIIVFGLMWYIAIFYRLIKFNDTTEASQN